MSNAVSTHHHAARVEIEGAHLAYRVDGPSHDAPVAVLLHSLGTDLRTRGSFGTDTSEAPAAGGAKGSDVPGWRHAGIDIPAAIKYVKDHRSLDGFKGGTPITNEELLTSKVDVLVPAGQDPPMILTRVYNQTGAGGTSGFFEKPVSVSGNLVLGSELLSAGVTGYLVAPHDPARTRFNVGAP